MKLNIAATVILYNPEDEIYENIESYVNDVDKVYVIDNSTNHNNNLIDKLKQSFKNIIYINNNANLGIATALNIGCNEALNNNYDWILTMDQDSKFLNFKHYKNCLLNLDDTKDIALLCANTNFTDKDTFPENPSFSSKETFSAITSANLLNLSLFEELGKFEDKLFIDLVDYDYCLRVQAKKYKILYFKDAIVSHALGAVFKRKNLITRKVRYKVEHNPQREYYFARNMMYCSLKYRKLFPKEFNIIKTLNMLLIHKVTKTILYEDQKLKKVYAKFLGVYHAMTNRYGKYDI